MPQESRKLHLGLRTESIVEETLNRHFYETLKPRRARDKFEAVEDPYLAVDEQVRGRLWKGLFGNASMPHTEEHVVENCLGSLDKYLRKGRRMNEEEMQSMFKRMHGKR
jgi:hypothetical protein